MKSNFEKLFLHKTEHATKEFNLAEKQFYEAKAKYASILESFVKTNIFLNESDLQDQFRRDIEYATESVSNFVWECPYEFHHPADIYEGMISSHINLIDNCEIPDIDPSVNLEAI